MLFADTPKALQDRLEQVVRLIRSKGVGVYFVTQSPGDLPDSVLAQLGLRIQHGLRAFTTKEQKSLRAVAEGFRPNPAFDALSVLTELGTGEALVGTLQERARRKSCSVYWSHRRNRGSGRSATPNAPRWWPVHRCKGVMTSRSIVNLPMKC